MPAADTQVDDNGNKTLDHFELTRAIKTINGSLVSDKEIEFIIRILDLMIEAGVNSKNEDNPEIREINFDQFACIAALSEKVAGLDELTKGAIAEMNFEALEDKITKCKDLFFLNDPKRTGEIPLDDLEVILQAGRIAQDNQDQCIAELRSKGYEHLTFLDFLAYCPLFVDIHKTITADPTQTERRAPMGAVMKAMSIGKGWMKKGKKGGGGGGGMLGGLGGAK